MEAIFGFESSSSDNTVIEKSGGYKRVPWINWEEWNSVRESLFSPSHHSIVFALHRISSWRNKGCLPVVIEVTASIIEIQQKDPFFRSELGDKNSDSDEVLAMLYCMAILRLVNGVVEKTRIRSQFSIAQAAAQIGLPRTLIDIRHEGSHRDLPSLNRLRPASVEALDWLKSYYWEPQRNGIPFQNKGKGIVKEVKSLFLELDLCLNSTTKEVKGKRSKKVIKRLVGLNATCSSEVISVLLKMLSRGRKQKDKSGCMFDQWTLMLSKLSTKEPQLLLKLLSAVMDMIKTQEDDSSDHLSDLFDWLLGILKNLKPSLKKDTNTLREADLVQLTRKCLVLSSTKIRLKESTLLLAKMIRNHSSLMKNLNKLLSIGNSHYKIDSELPFNLDQEEVSINQALEKLQSLKQQRDAKTVINSKKKKWVVVNSWNSCPLAMVPGDIGSYGCLPDMECLDTEVSSDSRPKDFEKREEEKPVTHKKRSPDININDLNCSDAKKAKVSEVPDNLQNKEEEEQQQRGDWKGRMVIDGVWGGINDKDLNSIISNVHVFV